MKHFQVTGNCATEASQSTNIGGIITLKAKKSNENFLKRELVKRMQKAGLIVTRLEVAPVTLPQR